MQLKEYSFRIDIRKRRDIEYIEVVQGDTGTNVFNITLLDGDNPYNLYNLHVEIIFKKADGTTVEQIDIEKTNDVQGKIRCVLKTNTIAFPGKVIAELKILDNEKMLTSTTFEFFVRKSLLDDDTIESSNEFPILTQLINETNELIETVRQIEEQVPENVVVKLNQLEETTNGLVTAFGDKIDKSSIANNTVTTVAGLVLDARQGKVLQDQINATNNNLVTFGYQVPVAVTDLNAVPINVRSTVFIGWGVHASKPNEHNFIMETIPLTGLNVALQILYDYDAATTSDSFRYIRQNHGTSGTNWVAK